MVTHGHKVSSHSPSVGFRGFSEATSGLAKPGSNKEVLLVHIIKEFKKVLGGSRNLT